MRFRSVILALSVLTCAAGAARAEPPPPAWPVRLNLSMPFGTTFGRETLHGFTWGFRPALLAYPTASGHGFGFGGFADFLIDAETHQMWSLGGLATAPVLSFDIFDLRAGGLVGARGSAEANDAKRRLVVGALAELVVPAYLYDFRVGLRVDSSFDERGSSARTLLLELDVVAVLGLVMYGASAK